MAIYHFSVQILGRGKGRRNQDGSLKKKPDNAVAAAAYRSGSTMTCERTGQESRYENRKGVAHTEILAPENSAPWLSDRNQLWNAVENMESRVDAQVAREINMALPHELGHADRVALVRSFVAEHFVSRGMVADFALHDPVAEKGDDPRNFHCHVMLTLRRATPDGLDAVKTREWNAKENILTWRKAWQEHVNGALRARGFTKQVDHRSLEDQREDARARGDMKKAYALKRDPEIHVGPRARSMQRRGFEPKSKNRRTGAPRRKWEPQVLIFNEGEASPEMVGWWYRQKDGTYRRKRERPRGEIVQQSYPGEMVRRTLPTPDPRPRRRWVGGEILTPELRQERAREFEARKLAAYRERRYKEIDRGVRAYALWNILLGNNKRAKDIVYHLDRRAARLDRWLDYWNRRANWWAEGKVRGGEFRYERWQVAIKEAHAKQRAAQVKELRLKVRQTVSTMRVGLEAGLTRVQQVARWVERQQVEREVERERDRIRERLRPAPSDPNDLSNATPFDNPPGGPSWDKPRGSS